VTAAARSSSIRTGYTAAKSPPDFVFSPLDYIETAADAQELAAIFEASTTKRSDKGGDS
jgi:hypothetical protein